jgi:serine/threonine-protein kinase
MDARAPLVVGRYSIHGKIASGGMASVHFGRQAGAAGFSRTVAIKRLHAHLAEDPEFRSTMIDEARLAARIHHPNVVPTLDVVADEGELLVVMEYVRGESLARLLRDERGERRRVPLPIASAIVIGVLHGLHAAHEATSDHGVPLGIVHRDVSPQNVLVGVDGVARVIDFGVAKAAGRLQMTREGAIKGKLGYMAPEQLAGGDARLATGDVGRASDIYAVGALLWEMLAGRRLFVGDNDAHLAVQVLLGAKEPPSGRARDVSPPIDALVMKALALDPADRFATALEMAEALLRAAPPAFSTAVGRWVTEAAGEAIAQRGADLARIESQSDATRWVGPMRDLAAPSSDRSRERSIVTKVDVRTGSSHPSSLSVETTSRSASPRRAGGALRVATIAALGALAAIALAVATLPWRRANPEQVRAASASTPALDAGVVASPVVSLSISIATAPSSVAANDGGDAGASAEGASAPRAAPTPRTRPKGRGAPKESGPFRFAQPD